MHQLSLFDLYENCVDVESRVRLTAEAEEDLKTTMALAIIEIHKKGLDDHGNKNTGA